MRKFRVVVNNSEYKVEIEEIKEEGTIRPVSQVSAPAAPPRPAVSSPSPTREEPPASAAPQQSSGGTGAIVAPMPGTVLRIDVEIGDSVTKGQTILVLEAMKMENEIQAPADGTIKELNASQGVSVNAGDLLVVLS
jgi:biotin carboxyl carrier protein